MVYLLTYRLILKVKRQHVQQFCSRCLDHKCLYFIFSQTPRKISITVVHQYCVGASFTMIKVYFIRAVKFHIYNTIVNRRTLDLKIRKYACVDNY
jgi:hypothetical protein